MLLGNCKNSAIIFIMLIKYINFEAVFLSSLRAKWSGDSQSPANRSAFFGGSRAGREINGT
jgi:hypothetical protein